MKARIRQLLLLTFLFLASQQMTFAARPGNTITADDVAAAQETWSRAVVQIGRADKQHKPIADLTQQMIARLYGYQVGSGVVLFIPLSGGVLDTLQKALRFYLGDAHQAGFVRQHWKALFFQNQQIYFHRDMAIARGFCELTPAEGQVIKVHFVFGYVMDAAGNLRIILQHFWSPVRDNSTKNR